MTTDQHAEKAKQLMRHYFSLAVLGSGQRWDSDNAGEVSDIVDHIIDACTADALENIAHTLNEISDRGSACTPAQPDALTRIADALTRIADRFDAVTIGPDSITVCQDPAA